MVTRLFLSLGNYFLIFNTKNANANDANGVIMGQNKGQIVWLKTLTENPAGLQVSLTWNIPLGNKTVIFNPLTLTFFANIKFILN